jgi:hypothetical protein
MGRRLGGRIRTLKNKNGEEEYETTEKTVKYEDK